MSAYGGSPYPKVGETNMNADCLSFLSFDIEELSTYEVMQRLSIMWSELQLFTPYGFQEYPHLPHRFTVLPLPMNPVMRL